MSASSSVRRTTAAVAVAAAALVTAAACGSASNATASSSSSPAAAARAALTGLGDSDAETVTIRVDGSAADLVALSKGQKEPLTTSQAQALAGAKVVVAAKAAGASFSDDLQHGATAGESYAVEVDSASANDLVQLVVADRKAYVRVDVQAAAPLLGGDLAQLQGIAGHLPAQAGFLGDLLAGRWIELDASQLGAAGTGTATATATATPSADRSQLAGLGAALGGVLSKDVTATRAAPDPQLGDHLVLAANARTLATDLLGTLTTTLASVPGASTALGSLPAQLPDKAITADEYVKDGTLSALRLRLDQLVAGATGPVTLEVDVASGATVTTPSSATPVDPSALSGLSSLF